MDFDSLTKEDHIDLCLSQLRIIGVVVGFVVFTLPALAWITLVLELLHVSFANPDALLPSFFGVSSWLLIVLGWFVFYGMRPVAYLDIEALDSPSFQLLVKRYFAATCVFYFFLLLSIIAGMVASLWTAEQIWVVTSAFIGGLLLVFIWPRETLVLSWLRHS